VYWVFSLLLWWWWWRYKWSWLFSALTFHEEEDRWSTPEGIIWMEGWWFWTRKIFLSYHKSRYPGGVSWLASIIHFIKTSLCEELIELIATELNGNYQKIVQTKKSPPSWLRWWRHTDISEMCTFLAINMLMVRNKKIQFLNTGQLTDCYVLQYSMKLHLQTISVYLCLCSTFVILKSNQKLTYKLFNISKINSVIWGKFAEAFLPFRNFHMRKQLSFWGKNCNPKNQLITQRLFVLCDVETGLVLDFVIQNTA